MRVGTWREARRALAFDHDGQDSAAVLAGGPGDQLLGPVAEPGEPGAAVGQHGLVVPGQGVAAQRGTQREPGIVRGAGQHGGHAVGLVEQPGHVRARQRRGHQAERVECAVPSGHVRIGEHDVVAGLVGDLLQRRPRVGDDHEPAGDLLRRQPEPGEGALVDATVAVGLDRRAALARHHHQRGVQPVPEGRGYLVRVGAVQHGQRHPRAAADHLRGQGRAARPGQHDVVQAVLAHLRGQRAERTEQ